MKATDLAGLLFSAFLLWTCGGPAATLPAGGLDEGIITSPEEDRDGLAELDKQLAAADSIVPEMKKAEALFILSLNNFISQEEQDSRAPGMILRLGNFYFERLQYGKAVDQYQLILSKYPEARERQKAMQMTALSYARNGEFDNAAAWYDKLKTARGDVLPRDQNEHKAGIMFREARALEKKKQYAEAGEIWLRLSAMFPETDIAPQALLMAGQMQEDLRHMKSAVKIYQRFSKVYSGSPLYPKALFREAWCWAEQGKQLMAAKKYLKIVSLFPAAEEARKSLYNAGLAFAMAGKELVAARALERYAELYPDSPEACPALRRAMEFYSGGGNMKEKVEKDEKNIKMKERVKEICGN